MNDFSLRTFDKAASKLLILVFIFTGCVKTEDLDPIQLTVDHGTWYRLPGVNDSIKVLATDGDYIWAGTESKGLLRIEPETFTVERFNTSNFGIPSNKITALGFDGTDMWVGTRDRGVAVLQGQYWVYKDYSSSQDLPNDSVTAMVVGAPYESNWTGTQRGLSADRYGGEWYLTGPWYQGQNKVTALAIQNGNTLWTGVKNYGIVVGDPEYGLIYNAQNSGLLDNHVRCIAFDNDGNGYAASFNKHYKIVGTVFEAYDMFNSGIPSEFVNQIVPDNNGKVYYATHGGFAIEQGGAWTSYNSGNSPLPHNVVDAVLIDDDNTKWIGTFDGIILFNEEGITRDSIPPGIF